MECWSDGDKELECWSDGMVGKKQKPLLSIHPNTPVLHYSKLALLPVSSTLNPEPLQRKEKTK